jgi:uncharacterized membrane protein
MSKQIIAGLLVAAAFAISVYYYPQMPGLMASHWGIDGQVNGYMPKLWALFLMPAVSLAMLGLFVLLPKIDPLKANYANFKNSYDSFIVFLFGFMFYIHILSIIWNAGARFDMGSAIAPAVAAVFYGAGLLLDHARPNWFVGIRTPWTLSSETVWNKTNKLGAILFKLFGAASLLGAILGGLFFFWVVVLAVPASIYLIVYSYLEFRKEKRNS